MPDKLTFYTIVAAFWCAFLVVLGVNLAGNVIMPGEEKLAKFGYPIEAVEETTGPAEAAAGGPRPDIKPLIVAASADDGQKIFQKCGSCHDASAGGPNKTGPNLHNIVGDTIGDRNGFKTSDSLKAIPGGKWTYDVLDDYIENPKHLAPKGTMSFVGLKKPAERAAVIKYLISQTDSPPPLDVAAPAAAAPAAAPAEAPKQ